MRERIHHLQDDSGNSRPNRATPKETREDQPEISSGHVRQGVPEAGCRRQKESEQTDEGRKEEDVAGAGGSHDGLCSGLSENRFGALHVATHVLLRRKHRGFDHEQHGRLLRDQLSEDEVHEAGSPAQENHFAHQKNCLRIFRLYVTY